MIIRKVTPGDLTDVTHVEATCFPELEAATEAEFNERIQTFSDSFFVAEKNGKIIGFINGGVTDEPVIADACFHDISLHNPDGAYQAVFGLDVMPTYRKQGIAGKLMKQLIDEARSKGRKGVILTCKEQLIPYYAKFGYENMGLSESTHGGSVWYDMMLEFQ